MGGGIPGIAVLSWRLSVVKSLEDDFIHCVSTGSSIVTNIMILGYLQHVHRTGPAEACVIAMSVPASDSC